MNQPSNTHEPPTDVKALSTGCLRLDIGLGCGGIVRGQFVEINGPEASGKTSLCLQIVASAQAMGEICAWIDVDHTLDASYALHCGVKAEQLYVANPESAEQALDIVESLARCGSIAVIVLDSLDALAPAEELRAPLNSTGKMSSDNLVFLTLRRLSQVLPRTLTTILFTGREQQRMSAVYRGLAQNPARLALKLHAGLRLQMRPIRPIEDSRQVIGQRVQVKIVKNRNCPFLDTIELDIMYNHGVVQTGDLFDLGVQSGVIGISKGIYTFQGMELGAEREAVVHLLALQPSLCRILEHILRQELGILP